jgi:hypothetical protein
LVGLHSTSPDNTSRWGALDIDAHDGGTANPRANWAAALAWYGRLRDLGFTPLLTDSNGRGGFHLDAIFATPVPTPRVFAFLQWLIADHRRHGLAVAPETFPKQPAIKPGGYGNWLRLPGRHHTRDHWSRVWDGRAWLEGEGAVEYILSLVGSPPSILPAIPLPPRPRSAGLARCPRFVKPSSDATARRIACYLARLPRRAAGQGRHDVGYGFACWLVRDLNLGDPAALEWLRQWDAGNLPPLGLDVLAELVACAHDYGLHGYGSGLGWSHASPVGRRHKTKTIRFTVEV